jgi:serine/threonine-protein kinase
MGTVFAAHHILLGQKVAIKFLVPESLGHSDSVARFVREARSTATIQSKHVVRVLDVAIRDGGPYIVMEYLEGCDLAAWLRIHGPPEVHVAVDFILQACDAIAEAHELGIIHRDLKPANLFAVQQSGAVDTIKVLDFGISKAAGLVSSTAPPGEWRPGAIITEERVPIGSPCYMSPEQMESACAVDLRTDIRALGVTLYELVTGRLPFEGQSLVQVYALIKAGEPLRLQERVPRGLAAVIRKCLEPERDRRYRSVRDLEVALAPFRAPLTAAAMEKTRRSDRPSKVGATESRPRTTPSTLPVELQRADTTLASAEPVTPLKRQRPRATTMAAIGFAALVSVVGVLGFVSKGQNPSESLASRSASPTVPASASTPPNTFLVASDSEVTKPDDREPNEIPSARTSSTGSPGAAASAHSRPVAAPALPRESHDSGRLEADSAPAASLPSTTAAPSTPPPEEWFPPSVPK